MNAAAKSLFAFGIYAIAAGSGLLITPGVVLATLGFPPVQDGWVRVVGTLAILLGVYHITAARNALMPYIKVSVWVRLVFAGLVAALVVSSLMPAPLLLFGALDVAGAVWTALALRRTSAPVAAL